MNTAQPRPTGSGVKTNNTKGFIELNASVPASRPTGEARARWRMQAISRRLAGMNHIAIRYPD